MASDVMENEFTGREQLFSDCVKTLMQYKTLADMPFKSASAILSEIETGRMIKKYQFKNPGRTPFNSFYSLTYGYYYVVEDDIPLLSLI